MYTVSPSGTFLIFSPKKVLHCTSPVFRRNVANVTHLCIFLTQSVYFYVNSNRFKLIILKSSYTKLKT